MLVLSRKTGDRIQIGPDITLTIVKVTGGTVRIGIDAPPHICIVREELYTAMENDAAVLLAEREAADRATSES